MKEFLVSTGSFQHSLSLVNGQIESKFPRFGAVNAAVPVEQRRV